MSVLGKTEKSLLAQWYFDTAHYQRELDAIGY